MAVDQFETLEDIEDWCVQQLARAAADPRSAFRWPVLCTAGPSPNGRVVVLRAFDQKTRTAVFYTDTRSAKCRDLTVNDRAQCVFFDQKKMVQIRASGPIDMVADGALKSEHFSRLKERAWQDYGSDKGAGAVIDAPIAEAALKETAARNFCVLKFRIETIDWLSLGRDGHKRARLSWAGRHENTWLVP